MIKKCIHLRHHRCGRIKAVEGQVFLFVCTRSKVINPIAAGLLILLLPNLYFAAHYVLLTTIPLPEEGEVDAAVLAVFYKIGVLGEVLRLTVFENKKSSVA